MTRIAAAVRFAALFFAISLIQFNNVAAKSLHSWLRANLNAGKCDPLSIFCLLFRETESRSFFGAYGRYFDPCDANIGFGAFKEDEAIWKTFLLESGLTHLGPMGLTCQRLVLLQYYTWKNLELLGSNMLASLSEQKQRSYRRHMTAHASSDLWKFFTSKFVELRGDTDTEKDAQEGTMTFLNPLGSGRESEVWTACKTHLGEQHHAQDEQYAVKIIRRTYKEGEKVNFEYTIEKNIVSLQDCTKFSDLLRKQRTQLPTSPGGLIVDNSPNDDDEYILHPVFCFDIKGGIRGRNASTPVSIVGRMQKHFQNPERSIYMGKGCAYKLADKDLRTFITEKIIDCTPFAEDHRANMAYRIAMGIRQMLQFDRVWLDCKASNILLFDEKPKLADLGFNRIVGNTVVLPGPGTKGFRPPEIERLAHKSRTTKSSAKIFPSYVVFSYGVTLYFMTYYRRPWLPEEIPALSADDKPAFPVLPCTHRQAIDPLLKDLLEKTLEVDHYKRITLSEVLLHPYFKKYCATCASTSRPIEVLDVERVNADLT